MTVSVKINGQPLGYWAPLDRIAEVALDAQDWWGLDPRATARARWPWSIEPGELPWPRLPGVTVEQMLEPPGWTAIPDKYGGVYIVTLEPRPSLWGRVVRLIREHRP